jgi:hypothetical protein
MQVHKVAEILASICGLVVAYDDFTGKPRQKRLKGALEIWWYKVSYMKWSAFGREEAMFAASVMQRLFGKLFSLRRLLICTAIFTALVGAAVLSPRGSKELRDLPPAEFKLLCEGSFQELKTKLGLSSEDIAAICADAQTFELDTEDILSDAIPKCFLVIIMWSCSLSLTIFLTKGVSRILTNQSWRINLLIYVGCLLVQLLLIAFSMSITVTTLTTAPAAFDAVGDLIDDASLKGKELAEWWAYIETMGALLVSFFKDSLDMTLRNPIFRPDLWYSTILTKETMDIPMAMEMALIILVATSINAGRLALVIIFLLSFLLSSVKDRVLVVWANIVESEKPVLTILFVSLGAVFTPVKAIFGE